MYDGWNWLKLATAKKVTDKHTDITAIHIRYTTKWCLGTDASVWGESPYSVRAILWSISRHPRIFKWSTLKKIWIPSIYSRSCSVTLTLKLKGQQLSSRGRVHMHSHMFIFSTYICELIIGNENVILWHIIPFTIWEMSYIAHRHENPSLRAYLELDQSPARVRDGRTC